MKDPYEAKYQLLINKIECTGLKYFNDSKAFIEYSNSMDDIYKNTEAYNSKKKWKILIVFDDVIADMLCHKKNYSSSNCTIYERKKTKYYSCFYYTILLCSSKKY